ncbi:hypothetical protein EDD86DRAFT_210470 [Gorgonomyces haynaldii]|nr:hypothetical protein EDD86DRAFT_210470 [Gorgonomyces haynaldii]
MLSSQWVLVAPWFRRVQRVAHPERLRHFTGSAVTWGVSIGVIALSFLEPTSITRRDIFVKIPVVGDFWQKKLDAMAQKD